ncbi:MAG: SLBB domain-containing protein [bacterium]|nr:SLBB domain-containing protein [bacterium]
MTNRRFLILQSILIILVCLCDISAIYGQADQPSDDLIHPGDLIEVDELGGFDYDWRGRLNPEGFLDGFTKIVDPIPALCRSPEQLAEAIRETYAKTLRDPRVIVRILDRSRRPLAILDGAIRQPMRLQIRRPVKISELAVVSGGFTDKASGEITILRPPNQSCDSPVTTTTVIKIRISEILAGNHEADIRVRSGDIVTVESVEPVYVTGGVNRPGRLDWREGATLSRIVAAAGGVTNRGVSGNVTIYRRVASDGQIIDADLDRVTSGKVDDVEILPFDIIDVPVRGARKRTSPPVVENVETGGRQQPLPLRVIN